MKGQGETKREGDWAKKRRERREEGRTRGRLGEKEKRAKLSEKP